MLNYKQEQDICWRFILIKINLQRHFTNPHCFKLLTVTVFIYLLVSLNECLNKSTTLCVVCAQTPISTAGVQTICCSLHLMMRERDTNVQHVKESINSPKTCPISINTWFSGTPLWHWHAFINPLIAQCLIIISTVKTPKT